MLHITFSNHVEFLLAALTTRLQQQAHSVRSPFVADEIIVPSAAIQRTVELAITDTVGICANVRFSYLARWLWRQIGPTQPDEPASPFEPAIMAWRIFVLFDDEQLVTRHARLRFYLQQADPVMRFDLAVRTAALFEQYLTYRSDWIERWSRGEQYPLASASQAENADQQWQAAVWQRLSNDLGGPQQYLSPSVLSQFKSALNHQPIPAAAALPTVHLFCLPTIAPAHLAALRELGTHFDIALYLRNPCQEYWFDIVAPRRLSYLASKGKSQHHEVGNRLLAAWGRQTQAQIDLIFETDLAVTEDDSKFIPNPASNLLAQLQNAILDLRELEPGSIVLAETDRSLEIHSCHSLTRELEVLQDQLLAVFAGVDPPAPSDILVMLPNLDESAALIDAVFGSAVAARRLPYAITGRPAFRNNVAAQALLDLLTLATSRVTASDVLALLQQSIVARRFGFGASQLDLLQTWLEQAGIRWGLDAAHRGRVGLPAQAAHTFDDGMERLFLGYALPSASAISVPFDQRIPAIDVEGSDAVVLGNFWHCISKIDALHHALLHARTALDWHAFLQGVMEDFLAPDDEQTDQYDELKNCLFALHDQFRRADLHTELPHEVVRTALGALLEDPLPGGVPTGCVTFASMSSLRNLPYKIICVLGLNDGVFPTPGRALEFDLMAVAPRRGDRQRGADDRNLLLDALLSARQRLILSYTGRGVRDNAVMPPSVLLADLLDYLVPAIATDATDAACLVAARRRLLIEHPLQPFSASYFSVTGDTRISSSNIEYCDALQQAVAADTPATTSTQVDDATDDDDETEVDNSQDAARFFGVPLSPPGPEWRQVSLEKLKQFFVNPCQYLLQERLGIRLLRDADMLEDDEPFMPDRNALHALEKRLLPLFLAGAPIEDIAALAAAGIELPGGTIGQQTLITVIGAMQQFASTLARATQLPCLPAQQTDLYIDLDGETWQLDTTILDRRAGGLVRSRYGVTRPADYVAGWIDHLALNATLPVGTVGETMWLSSDGSYRLHPTEDARRYLAELLALYRYGLSQPLHFFPKTAWTYYTRSGSLAAARNTWQQTARRPFAEQAHPAYRLALRGIADPLDAEFQQTARTVFAPLHACLEDARK